MNARKFVLIAAIALSLGVFFKRRVKDFILATPLPDLYCRYFRDIEDYDEDHVVSELTNGMRIIVNKRDRCVCRFIRITGRWDANELAAVEKIIRPGFKVIEVGSNFGCYTLVMAGLVGAQGKISAFEANPKVSKYLEESVKLNGLDDRVTVYKKAVANKPYAGMMIYGAENIGGGYIFEATADTERICRENPNCLPIEAVTLDGLFKDEKTDVLKIDAEGAEPWIIEGADKLIKNNPNIILIMEWIVAHMERNKINVPEFVESLKSRGFKFWAIRRGGKLERVGADALAKAEPMDIVASARDMDER